MEMNFEELEYRTYQIEENEQDLRLDKFLSLKEENISRNYLQSLIKEGYVFVNEKAVQKASYRLALQDQVILYFKPVEDLKIEAENIPLDIIYQDEDLAIINKKAGMVVHPSPGHPSHTLVNAILYHIHDLSSINGITRPGIVHRLDKDTSGLLVIAKNDIAHRFLAEQLKDHSMSRTYLCLVKGILESKKGIIKTQIARDKSNRLKNAVVNENGKEAITEFEVLETIQDRYSFLRCHLKTGRTHQIRVHMNFIKHPIINDPLYGTNNKIMFPSAQLLHACELTLIHPRTKERMTFSCDLPEHFVNALNYLKNS